MLGHGCLQTLNATEYANTLRIYRIKKYIIQQLKILSKIFPKLQNMRDFNMRD